MEDCSLRTHALETSRILWIVCHNFFFGGGCFSYRNFISIRISKGSVPEKLIHWFVCVKEGRSVRGKRGARPFDVAQNNRLLDYGLLSY